ncbi:MAG TPA: sulfatase-like hydrolase/transferase [Thermoanaerobaculia bacterium]|nr:sulfatase-like hydrolase/transferase [Thermoanaerobaculia bacterium]
MIRAISTYLLLAALFGCTKETPAPDNQQPASKPNILLITLDTTRADALGEATPTINALAKRGRRFTQAYCTVPQTLPSHASMMTGLYPAGHGVHENARYLGATQSVLAERLHAAGYSTAAFVSAFALARRFGLGRGFDVYDEDFGENRAERNAQETTDRAAAYLAQAGSQPRFVWVHYYDPHFPYTPPEPYRTRYAKNPYLGEIAFMDEQLGRLVKAFGDGVIVIAADHGEGLGDHGELQHGDLLYQSTMHVPLLLAGPGIEPGTTDAPVSTRRVFHTILDLAGIDASHSLRSTNEPVLLGEAMKPFLDYSWQPQVMAVEGRLKTILAGRTEVYDVVADPKELHDLSATAGAPRATRAALRDYPMPSATPAPTPATLDDEAQRKLASLGYVASTVAPVVRADAPRPADMTALFPLLENAAALFVRGQYAACIPLLETILARDPHNLDAALRLATSYSSLGRNEKALTAFKRAEAIAPESQDVRTYLALHYARTKDWEKAVPLLERIVAETPDRLPAVEALALVRERQQRIPDAVALRQQIAAMRTPTPAELSHLGEMQMAIGDTAGAIASFEKTGPGHELELGVLYLAARRFADAREALDRVPPSSPNYPMALFKRAQVSVLLREPDAPARIAAARARATPVTRPLIEREKLFQ